MDLTNKELEDMIEIAKIDDWNYISYKNIRKALTEFKQLRRSQMKPAVKYLGNSVEKQLIHMDTEVDEIFNEYYYKDSVKENIDIEKLAMEVIDLQFSCQTMLEGPLGLSKEQIADYVQMVVKKNADRNYDKA